MLISEKSPKLLKLSAKGSTSVAQRFNFTKKGLDQLSSPQGGQRAYHYDTHVRGLALAVSPAGRKTFILYRKIAGRPERITIGPYPDLSIEQARGRASELNAVIAKGENPAAQKRQIRNEATLKELFLQFGEHYASGKRTWVEMQRVFDVYLHPWHFRKISSIRRLDVVALQNRLKRKNGLYTANHVTRLLSSMFNRAAEWGWKGDNPASRVPLFQETKRDRFLLPEELSAFFNAVDAEPNETIRDFIYIALLTGGRRANVQAMRWPEIDFNQQVWNIPASSAKMGDLLTIPLLPKALEILERRRDAAKNELERRGDAAINELEDEAINEWVFASSGRSGHLVEPKTAWKRIMKAAGLSDLRLHDLRRTMGSWQAITGSSLLVIGKSLGHKSVSATAIYARLNDGPVRESMQRATTALLLASKIQDVQDK
jgi:integrase